MIFRKLEQATYTLWLVLQLSASGPLLAQEQGALSLLDKTIEPGNKQEFPLLIDQSFDAAYINMPIYAIQGLQSGHRLCVTAGIHGDEINGSEIARRVFAKVDPLKLHGTVIMLPMINTSGIRNGERYMPDRRDLNRFFPGSYDGSIASIIARATFDIVTTHCDTLVDLHTGSFQRANAPQVRVTDRNPEALALARNFGSGIVVLGDGPKGSLRREASDAGMTAIIYEAAGPHIFDVEAADIGVRGLLNVMRHLELLPGESREIPDDRVYWRTSWERVPLGTGGFFFPEVTLGARVKAGQRLGYLVSPLHEKTTVVNATHDGVIIGMAKPQIVLSGYALFHLGTGGRSGKLTEEELRNRDEEEAMADG